MILNNAAFIAAANPATIKALIARVRELESRPTLDSRPLKSTLNIPV